MTPHIAYHTLIIRRNEEQLTIHTVQVRSYMLSVSMPCDDDRDLRMFMLVVSTSS